MQDLTFKAYSSSGQLMGSSPVQSGREVVAVRLKGRTLTVSPSVGARMYAQIDIDKTDFKQGVAYLFEMRKAATARYQKEKERRARDKDFAQQGSLPKPSTRPGTASSKTGSGNQSSGNSLFEDLPQPGDFGHGKFCICGDCRAKRSKSGSLKLTVGE